MLLFCVGNAESAAKIVPVKGISQTLHTITFAVDIVTLSNFFRNLLCSTSAASPTLGLQPALHRHN